MRPVDPTTVADNPVTRVLNMVLHGDGSLRKRLAIQAGGLPSATVNHIVCHLLNGASPTLVIKTANSVQFTSDGTSFSALSFPTDDPPIGAIGSTVGSFALYSGELYYADSSTVFSWDGLSFPSATVRRPGVVSLDGQIYNRPALPHLNDLGVTFSFGVPNEPDYGPPVGTPIQYIPVVTYPDGPADPSMDPFIIIYGKPADDPDGTDNELVIPDTFTADDLGEKTLNTGFALSYYDPQRGLFGRRTEVFALPYIFAGGNQPDNNIPQLLTNARAQYAKAVRTPDAPAGHPDYKVAVWFTRGFLPAANTSVAISGGWYAVSLWAPAMSKRMNQVTFLEGIFDPGFTAAPGPLIGPEDRAVCKKDDATLFASARYLDIYSRPVPCRFMMILPNGVALYFNPRAIPTREEERGAEADPDTINNFPLGNYAEYSVNHPEQIGRNTETLRDTKTPIPDLKGQPLRAISDGINTLLFTNLAVYRVGFQQGIVLSEITEGRGVRSPNSITSSSTGMLWMSDDGVVWMRGGQLILLDRRLGFTDWFEKMTNAQRSTVVIGVCEHLNQIIVIHQVASGTGAPGQGENTFRALVYDYEQDFVSEWTDTLFSAVTYATFFRSLNGPILTLTGANYPAPTPTTAASSIEMWISDEATTPKHLGFIELRLGPRTGSLIVTVTAHDHKDTGPEYAPTASRTATAASSTTGTKTRLHQFLGMRGRMFRITIAPTTASTDWTLQEVTAEYTLDETEDARSV